MCLKEGEQMLLRNPCTNRRAIAAPAETDAQRLRRQRVWRANLAAMLTAAGLARYLREKPARLACLADTEAAAKAAERHRELCRQYVHEPQALYANYDGE